MNARRRIAIIGAGVAGLAAARRLAPAADITLFEKSRGPGGRLAHRRADPFAFDFGAQFITARDPGFRQEADSLAARGLLAPWQCRFAEFEGDRLISTRPWTADNPHFTGVGRMTAIAAAWAEGLEIFRTTRITALRRASEGWFLDSDKGEEFGPFDFALLSIPAAQAADLLPDETPLRELAAMTRMQGCFALMLGFEDLPDLGFDAAMIRGSKLSWLSVSRSRPGHEGGASLVALSANDWADAHIDDPLDGVRETMMAALRPLTGSLGAPRHSDLHRWRYANCGRRAETAQLIDPDRGLGVCGDWTAEGRVEAAFLSGRRAADMILGLFAIDRL